MEVIEPKPVSVQAAPTPTPGCYGPYSPTGWPIASNSVNPPAPQHGWIWPAVPPPPTSWPCTPSPLPWAWVQGWPWGLPFAAPTTAAPCQPTPDSIQSAP